MALPSNTAAAVLTFRLKGHAVVNITAGSTEALRAIALALRVAASTIHAHNIFANISWTAFRDEPLRATALIAIALLLPPKAFDLVAIVLGDCTSCDATDCTLDAKLIPTSACRRAILASYLAVAPVTAALRAVLVLPLADSLLWVHGSIKQAKHRTAVVVAQPCLGTTLAFHTIDNGGAIGA